MPITIKSSRMQYRKSNGDYVGVDAVSERKTSEYISEIESTGSTTQSAIEQTASAARDAIDTKAQQARDSIPSDYTALSDEVSDLKSALDYNGIGNSFDGQLYNGYWNSDGTIIDISGIDVCNKNKIPCEEGNSVVIIANTSFADPTLYISYLDDSTRIHRDSLIGTKYSGKAPTGTKYVCFTFEKLGISKDNFGTVSVYINNQIDIVTDEILKIKSHVSDIDEYIDLSNYIVPKLVNGSSLNRYNLTTVSPKNTLTKKDGLQILQATYTDDFQDGYHIIWGVYGYTEEAIGMDTVAANDAGYTIVNREVVMPINQRSINLLDYLTPMVKCFSVNPWVIDSNGSTIPLRIVSNQNCIRISQSYLNIGANDSDSIEQVSTELNNSRHITDDVGFPLTLLHFSDLHGDTDALFRIMKQANENNSMIDDIICTGDMVANTATPISSWWDEDVLTCIGNHDAASYSSETGYDWDALSMSDRVAYYIAPFETNWGITRESGKSYYYKDYVSQKVRLIVMDAQSYIANGEEATAQTAWLEGLLSSAISNDLHVVIAIHAPYNNAPIVSCSFSRFGRTNMATLGDSFTSQSVVDAVAAAISNGLNFIGYLVGHNHQDYIYKPTASQIGFCVTCAAVSQRAQWVGSDQHRSITEDAYNIVTIDTANTIVKVVRGGGADIDNVMRTRKAISFNYSTGEKVGEIL